MKEDLLVAWALQNQEEFWMLADRFHEGTCRTEPWNRIWPLLLKGYNDHERFPELSEVDQLINRLRLEPPTKIVASDILRKAYTTPVSGYTSEDIKRHLIHQEFQKLGTEMLEAADKHQDVPAQLAFYQSKLERIGNLTGNKAIGTRYSPFDNPRQWWEKLAEGYGGDPLPTPFPRLNRKLRGGGMLPTLVLLVGPTGGGKSTLLKCIEMHATRIGGRWVNYTLDDSEGDMLERQYSHLLQRPILPIDLREEERRERIGLELEEKLKEYPGYWDGYSIEPNRYTFRDLTRHLTQLQSQYYHKDAQMVKAGLLNLPEEEWGRIDGIGIDTGDQMRGESGGKNEWYLLEKLYENAAGLAKRFKCPVVSTVQGNQETVGASQITVRNIGGSYGKAKPAKLILAVAQTVQQSQNAVTIDPTSSYVTDNREAMYCYNPQTDHSTEWESAYICIIKNTMASSEVGRGLVKHCMLPVLIDFATCRMVEDFSKPEELMRADRRTIEEERSATGGGAPSNTGKRGPK